jgi:hypothetical protein
MTTTTMDRQQTRVTTNGQKASRTRRSQFGALQSVVSQMERSLGLRTFDGGDRQHSQMVLSVAQQIGASVQSLKTDAFRSSPSDS